MASRLTPPESVDPTPVGVTDGSAATAGGLLGAAPTARLLADADYIREGNDLKLLSEDGSEFLVRDYFNASAPQPLIADDGSVVSGQAIHSLVGYPSALEFAQVNVPTPSQIVPIGKIGKLSGKATITGIGGSSREAKLGEAVNQGETILTDKGASIAIRFSDGTVLAMQEDSRLVLNEFSYQPGGTSNSAILSVLKGTFSLVAGLIVGSSELKVETPVATMGIRGTTVLGLKVDTNNGHVTTVQNRDGSVSPVSFFHPLNSALISLLDSDRFKIILSANGEPVVAPKSAQDLLDEAPLIKLIHELVNFFNLQQGLPPGLWGPLTGSPLFDDTIQEISFEQLLPDFLSPTELLDPLPFFIPPIRPAGRPSDPIPVRSAEQDATPPVLTAGVLGISGLAENNIGSASAIFTGVLPINFGPAGPGAISLQPMDGLVVQDTDGNPIEFMGVGLVYVWDPNSLTLTAQNEASGPVFVIQITDPTTGAFTWTLLQAIDHPLPGADTLVVGLIFEVTDGDGNTVEGAVFAALQDDIPHVIVSAANKGPLSLPALDETPGELADISDENAGDDEIDLTAAAIGTMRSESNDVAALFNDDVINVGRDGTGGASNTTYELVLRSADGTRIVNEDKAVDTTLFATGDGDGVREGHERINLYQVSATVIEGRAALHGDGKFNDVIFRVVLENVNPDDPILRVDQFRAISHSTEGDDADAYDDAEVLAILGDAIAVDAGILIAKQATIVDGDDDTATASAEVNITSSLIFEDDGIQATSYVQATPPVSALTELDEDSLALLVAGDFELNELVVSGTDGIRSFDLSNNHLQPVLIASTETALTAAGIALVFFWDGTSNTLYASTDTSSLANAIATAVFKVSVEPQDGALSLSLLAGADHIGDPYDDTLLVDINYRAFDGDNDFDSGIFRLSLRDSDPVITSVYVDSVDASTGQINGTIDVDYGADGPNADGASLVISDWSNDLDPDPLSYALSNDGRTLTATDSDNELVYVLAIDDETNSYSLSFGEGPAVLPLDFETFDAGGPSVPSLSVLDITTGRFTVTFDGGILDGDGMLIGKESESYDLSPADQINLTGTGFTLGGSQNSIDNGEGFFVTTEFDGQPTTIDFLSFSMVRVGGSSDSAITVNWLALDENGSPISSVSSQLIALPENKTNVPITIDPEGEFAELQLWFTNTDGAGNIRVESFEIGVGNVDGFGLPGGLDTTLTFEFEAIDGDGDVSPAYNLIVGTASSDTMVGQAGTTDTFVLLENSTLITDLISDYDAEEGDLIDLTSLFDLPSDGEDDQVDTKDLSNYVDVDVQDGTLYVDAGGDVANNGVAVAEISTTSNKLNLIVDDGQDTTVATLMI